MINTNVHSPSDELARIIIRNKTEIVTESLCAKWDNRYLDITFAPSPARNVEFACHNNSFWLIDVHNCEEGQTLMPVPTKNDIFYRLPFALARAVGGLSVRAITAATIHAIPQTINAGSQLPLPPIIPAIMGPIIPPIP
jgi:hypothetical protein